MQKACSITSDLAFVELNSLVHYLSFTFKVSRLGYDFLNLRKIENSF